MTAEYVEEYEYQSQQQFLSDSPWDHRPLMERVAGDVNQLLGGEESGLLIDESGFAKKGDKSAGVARQWNGRLGKVDNCQVGVFAALSDGKGSALVDGRLYLPQCWSEDDARCRAAKIPREERHHRSKPELALEMIGRAADLRLKFGWVGFDALYGSTPWLLREIEERGLIFVGDVRGNQRIYTEDPRPYLPRRRKSLGRKIVKRCARTESREIQEVFAENGETPWKTIVIRETTKGRLKISACRKRVWLWDGQEENARCWWAVCTVDEATGETKFFLSNAPETTSLETLVRRHAVRYWVERGFQDAKTSLGMADYQARGWGAWHHHMAMVMLAMLFQLRERRVHLLDVELLSTQDVVELLNVYLPRKDTTVEAVIRNIERRHRKRRQAIESACRPRSRST